MTTLDATPAPARRRPQRPRLRVRSLPPVIDARADHVGSLLRPRALLDAARGVRGRGARPGGVQGASRTRAVREVVRAPGGGRLPGRDRRRAAARVLPGRARGGDDGRRGRRARRLAVGRLALRRARRQGRGAARRDGGGRPARAAALARGRGVHVPALDHRARRRRSRCPPPRCSRTSGRPSARATPIRASTTSWPTWWRSSPTRCASWRGSAAATSSSTRRTTRCSIDPGWRAFYEARGWPIDRCLVLRDRARQRGDRRGAGRHVRLPPLQAATRTRAGSWPAATTTSRAPIFRGVHAHRLLLEYDDERSGGFEPLREVPDDKLVDRARAW